MAKKIHPSSLLKNKNKEVLQTSKNIDIEVNKILGSERGSSPSLPTQVDEERQPLSKSEARLKLEAAQSSFKRYGTDFDKLELFKEMFDIDLSKSTYQRELNSPYDHNYYVVGTFYDSAKIHRDCVIDGENIRDGQQRSAEALKDIYSEIALGYQIQPIIGYIGDNGKLSIVDGSRRYTAAKLAGVGLNVEIFDRKPTKKFLSWYIRSTDLKKKFSYYELGKLYRSLMDLNDWSQADIAKNTEYDKRDVSFCLDVFEVNKRLMDIFPSKDFTFRQAKSLVKLSKAIIKEFDISKAIAFIKAEFDENVFSDKKEITKYKLQLLAKFVSKDDLNTSKNNEQLLFEKGEQRVILLEKGNKSNIVMENIPLEIRDNLVQLIMGAFNGR